MREIWGKFILGLADVLDFLIGGLIKILQAIVDVISGLGKSVLSILALLACSGFVFFLPILIIYLPVFLIVFIFFIVIPLLGRKFISYLEFLHYSAVEYLRNYGDYLINNRENYKSYQEFKKAYRDKKEEEERKRREQERAQNEFWEEVFRNFSQGSSGSGTYYRTYRTGQQNSNGYGGYYQNQNQNYSNPLDDFKKKYENSCAILEVPVNTNTYEVKTAYRKMAKKYHPDINKSESATEMFQKVNEAYEFLTEENIKRYNQYTN